MVITARPSTSVDTNVLFVKHLPSELTSEDKKHFFELFGAQESRIMPDKGQFKNTAFVMFANHDKAKEAMGRIHQLEVLGCLLSAEFSNKIHDNAKSCTDTENISTKSDKTTNLQSTTASLEKSNSKKCKFCQRLPPISPNFGLEYPSNPGLKYKYPEPQANILLNICAALVTVPKLYTQVLHLMNKMDLYPPFSAVTHIPPVLLEFMQQAFGGSIDPQHSKEVNQNKSESEYESSDGDHPFNPNLPPPKRAMRALKRKKKVPHEDPKRKLAKLISLEQAGTSTTAFAASKTKSSEDLFEKSDLKLGKPQIAFNVSTDLPATERGVSITKEDNVVDEASLGFGKIQPVQNPAHTCSSNTDEYTLTFDFIPLKHLDSGRLTSKERSSHPLFKQYRSGDPSCRLYVKNLAKKVTEKDLRHIFGGFVNFEDEEESKMFDIRLMTQGRMKGQAFIGLPSIESAKRALKAVNGYQLIGKPMVVLYARSAKPKADQSK